MVYGVGGEHLFLIWRKGVKTLIYNIQVIWEGIGLNITAQPPLRTKSGKASIYMAATWMSFFSDNL
jgi:hypothetical protein